jgi:nitrogen fixation protein NifZ
MTEPVLPKFEWGQRVRALIDLYNDGSFPECADDQLLVQMGDAGEIVQVGTHVESNTTIYLVEFAADRVIGCLEQEIALL